MTRYVTLAEYFRLAEQVTSTSTQVLLNASRTDLVDSALHAPAAGFGDDDFYPNLFEKAAVLTCRLAWNHPLPVRRGDVTGDLDAGGHARIPSHERCRVGRLVEASTAWKSDRVPARTSLLPDPPAAEQTFTIISVDDHLIEPRDLFAGRVPQAFADRAPRVIEDSEGNEVWDFDGSRYPQVGLNAIAGRPKSEWSLEPTRFDEMRRGCFDADARVADMDLDGVYASLCFPSLIAGFAGTVFARTSDPELGLACLRAWNRWMHEEWAGAHPDRLIANQLPWLLDPALAAAEIHANAARGFVAVSFPENPVDLGLPSMHTDHWDPFLRACEETGTVVCLHNASSGWTASRSPGAPLELYTTLFPVNAMVAAADWLWAGIPSRFPTLDVAFSEGGIGWVPMLIDRIDYVLDHSASGLSAWKDPDLSPTDALRRNFWFCTIDVSSTFALRDHIGVDHIMMETDYPHADSSWPDTQARARRDLAGIPDEEIRMITWQTAARLFRVEIPAALRRPAIAGAT